MTKPPDIVIKRPRTFHDLVNLRIFRRRRRCRHRQHPIHLKARGHLFLAGLTEHFGYNAAAIDPDRRLVPEQITQLLIDWNGGSAEALEKLLPMVDAELRRMASRHMRRERTGHTLQTTALVNEAYLKLVDQREVRWQNRAHFFALSSQIMRRILLDHARAQGRAKRGGDAVHINLENATVVSPEKSEELLALDEALQRLEKFDQKKSRIVEMRFFGGLTIDEVAEVLGIAPITVMQHWRLAKAWLQREIRSNQPAQI